MNLSEAILIVMIKAVPPGRGTFTLTREAFAVEPVPSSECQADAPTCPGARRSSFYGTWVRRESVETAKARYRLMAEGLAHEVTVALEGEGRRWGQGVFAQAALAGVALGIQVNESGQREDVVMGRGRSGRTSPGDKQYDDAGGQGRGPGNEACAMQVLPSMAVAFGGADALLGLTPDALGRCYRAALSQITHARRMCPASARRIGKDFSVGWLYATVSRYGNGFSCTSGNNGKTAAREKSAMWMISELTRLLRAP